MNNSLTLAPTLWTELPDISEVDPISDKDRAVLSEIKTVLEKHGALGRFGVSLLHKHFDLVEDEVLVEYSDPERRTQSTRVQKKSGLKPENRIIQTQWQFAREAASGVCVQYCDYNAGHRHIHQFK